MSNILEYKGYRGKINFSAEDNVLYGRIEGINALVTFEGDNVDEIKSAFEESVDNYLQFCEENNIKPEKEYKGCFNVRIAPEIHRKISAVADRESISLNKCVEKALISYIDGADGTSAVTSIRNTNRP